MAIDSDPWWSWRLRSRGRSAAGSPAVSAQDLYAALIKDRVSPLMRAEGLAGSGGRYSLRSNSHWALVGFQRSQYSDRYEIQFTVNLFVVRRDEWDASRREYAYYPIKPTATVGYGLMVPMRIGSLVGDGGDKWWRLYPGQDLEFVEEDLFGDLRSTGLPWLRERVAGLR